MARLKDSNNEPINLFPMIDILTGTIGIFIFFISAVSVLALGPGRSVAINTASAITGKHQKKPVYIEWDGSSVVLHPEKKRVPLSLADLTTAERARARSSAANALSLPGVPARQTMERAQTDPSSERASDYSHAVERKIKRQIEHTPFDDLLQRIYRARNETYLVVMVRPSGFDTFLTLRNYLLKKGLDVGYDPIAQEWNIEVK